MSIAALTKKQKEVIDFLKKFYEENGYSPSMKEVAKNFEVSIPTVQGYFTELKLKGVISKQPNKSRSIIFKTDIPKNMTISIPLNGTISAGEGILVNENNEPEMIEVPSSWINKYSMNDYYCLKVRGFSMYKDGILDGDIILVKYQPYANNGETVVAIRKDSNDERATLKVFFDRGNKIELKPKNDFLKSIVLNKEDIEIRGKFCGLIREENS